MTLEVRDRSAVVHLSNPGDAEQVPGLGDEAVWNDPQNAFPEVRKGRCAPPAGLS